MGVHPLKRTPKVLTDYLDSIVTGIIQVTSEMLSNVTVTVKSNVLDAGNTVLFSQVISPVVGLTSNFASASSWLTKFS